MFTDTYSLPHKPKHDFVPVLWALFLNTPIDPISQYGINAQFTVKILEMFHYSDTVELEWHQEDTNMCMLINSIIWHDHGCKTWAMISEAQSLSL